jgi:hypothetical protein
MYITQPIEVEKCRIEPNWLSRMQGQFTLSNVNRLLVPCSNAP